MSTFETDKEDIIPVFAPYVVIDVLNAIRCAIWCQQEAECEVFTVKQLSTGRIKCLLYNGRPLSVDYRPEAGAVTMELTKYVYK